MNALQFTVRLLLQIHAVSCCVYGVMCTVRTVLRLHLYAFIDTSNCLRVRTFADRVLVERCIAVGLVLRNSNSGDLNIICHNNICAIGVRH